MTEQRSRAHTHKASACHLRVTRADGRVEHHSKFCRPRPIYSLTGWRWLAGRYLEYRRMEKT